MGEASMLLRVAPFVVCLVVAIGAPASSCRAQEPDADSANEPPAEVQQATTADAQPTSGDSTKGDSAKGEPPAGRQAPEDEIMLREFLVLPPVGVYGRQLLHQNPIDAALASGEWKMPKPGDEVTAAGGKTVAWREGLADSQGRLSGPAVGGGYAVAKVTLPKARVLILQATHHAAACVNGQWLTGDPYGYGWVQLPVQLKAGDNTLLFQVARPGFTAKLVAPPSNVQILTTDTTLPDFAAAHLFRLWAAAPILNATSKPIIGAELRVTIGETTQVTPLPTIAPLTLFKAPFRLPRESGEGDKATIRVALHRPQPNSEAMSPDPSAACELQIRRVEPLARQVHTFLSKVDGSVQAYSVVPASKPLEKNSAGLILALHGLGTDHQEFAKNFEPKEWAHVVVPQNRRPYGFDWQDWGAEDAMEALADARKRLNTDPRRTYITGHGLGGYGAWQLAMRYPDQFAAIGPSAGVVRFGKRGADDPANASPVAALLARSQSSTEAPRLLRNLSQVGVYMLHGANDQKVSPAQSRFMRSRLGEFHSDFVYYERPGAGHWWGPEGVDWPAMNEFFRSHQVPLARDVRRVDFTTDHASLSAECYWARIQQQANSGQPSRVVLERDVDGRTISGRTENVSLLSLDVAGMKPGMRITVRLDDSGQVRTRWPGRSARIWLAKKDSGQWTASREPPPTHKTPRRGGPFKTAFANRALLVYGTGGTKEENEWALAKARYDAQAFWRRGNGALQVMADTDFDASSEPNRNVILYGNSTTNEAWPVLLSTSPVQVRKGRVEVGQQSSVRPETGDDLATLMIRPRLGSTRASVGVVGGTGIHGMRLTNRLRYFVSGTRYPDLLVFGPDVLMTEGPQSGVSDVRAAGDFDNEWNVNSAEILWRDLAL